MTERAEKDFKEVTRREEKLRQKLAEVYPNEKFPYGLFSPQTGHELLKRIVPGCIIGQLESIKDEIVQQNVKELKKRSEVFELWQDCYNAQNS